MLNLCNVGPRYKVNVIARRIPKVDESSWRYSQWIHLRLHCTAYSWTSQGKLRYSALHLRWTILIRYQAFCRNVQDRSASAALQGHQP